jgi:replicative DNA helicase
MSRSIGFGALKSLITSNAPFSELIELGADETFFKGKEQLAFNFIKTFKYNHGKYPELTTVAAECGGVDWEHLPQEPLEYWVSQLRERKQFDLCKEASNKITELLHSNKTKDTVQLLRYYTDLINKTDLSFSLKDLPDVQEEVLKRHDEVQQNPGISGIPFGFPALDEITYGSQKGDFNVIVGVTGACKSYMSLKSALTAYYAGNNVIFISPEMPEEQIARRLLGIQTQLRDSDIRKGKLSYYAIEKAKQIIRTPISIEGKVQDNYFKILPSGLYSDVNSIISVCSEYKPDFLCIDGFYLLKNSAIRTNSAWREDESVIFALKNFSIHSQIPILATTQYNRAKPGKIEGARGTQSTEQISSNFLSLEFENPEDRDTMRPIQTRLLKIKKSRDGDSAIIRVKLNFNKMTIEEDTIIRGDEGFEPEFEDDQFIGDL